MDPSDSTHSITRFAHMLQKMRTDTERPLHEVVESGKCPRLLHQDRKGFVVGLTADKQDLPGFLVSRAEKLLVDEDSNLCREGEEGEFYQLTRAGCSSLRYFRGHALCTVPKIVRKID